MSALPKQYSTVPEPDCVRFMFLRNELPQIRRLTFRYPRFRNLGECMSPIVDPTSLFDQAVRGASSSYRVAAGTAEALLQRIDQNMTRAILAGKKVLWCRERG